MPAYNPDFEREQEEKESWLSEIDYDHDVLSSNPGLVQIMILRVIAKLLVEIYFSLRSRS